MKSTILFYNDLAIGGSSDKEYRIQIEKTEGGFLVNFQYGRRGGTLQTGTKTPSAVGYKQAVAIYEKLVHEKESKGYKDPLKGKNAAEASAVGQSPSVVTDTSRRTPYPQERLEEIGTEDAETFIKDSRYIMQVKANGHFRQAQKLPDGSIISFNKNGEPKTFPREVEADLAKLKLQTFFFDGELVGNAYFVFQMLEQDGISLAPLPYEDRRRHAEAAVDGKATYVKTVATWISTKDKQAGIAACKKARVEGVCFKRVDAPYRAGESRVHKKFKFLKSATCKVLRTGDKGHESATLGLLDGKKWIEVGRVSLIGKDKRIDVGSLVEITFLYATAGRRLYQPRIKELRDDVRESECTIEQLRNSYQEGVAA